MFFKKKKELYKVIGRGDISYFTNSRDANDFVARFSGRVIKVK